MLQQAMEALNAKAIAFGEPITLTNAPQLLLPVVVLGAQAYAVTLHGTKSFRVALWPVAAALVLRTWFGFRFTQPHLQDFNYALGITAIHLIVKSTELALANRPTPPVQLQGRPTPSHLRQAINIAINSRHVGLPPNPPLEPFNPPQSHLSSSLYHIRYTTIHYLLFNTIFYAIHAYAPVTLGNPAGGSLEAFAADMTRAYPSSEWIPTSVQRLGWDFVATLTAGLGVYQGMTYLYHTFAALAVGIGRWQPEEWPPFYNRPWAATSLYEFWGKRWHQLFRHQFILIAQGLQTHLNLPTPLLPLTVFSLSGLLHVIGALTANPLPQCLPIFSFFALSGVGCTLELTYRQLRGKRVGGLGGWLWTWSWLAWTGRSVARSWIASGVLGGTLVWERMDIVGFVMSLRDEKGVFPTWATNVGYVIGMCCMLYILDRRGQEGQVAHEQGALKQTVKSTASAPMEPTLEIQAVPGDLSARVGPSHSSRRNALFCFPLLILLALPFWDYTTRIERLPLPVERIQALSTLQIPEITSKVLLTIEDRVYPADVEKASLTRALVRDIRLASDGIIHRELRIAENRTWDIITAVPAGQEPPALRVHVFSTIEARTGFPLRPYLLAKDSKLPAKDGKKQMFKAGTYVVPVHPSHMSDSMFRNHLANAIIRPLIALLPTAPLPAPLRALKYSKDITLSFVLLNEDASGGGFISSWDIQDALDRFILPHLRPLKPVHNFSIETQVLLHAPLSFKPTWVVDPVRLSATSVEEVVAEAEQAGGNEGNVEALAEAALDRQVKDGIRGAWQVDDEQIKEFVNAEQWSLDSGSSNDPVLRFLLFAPSAAHRPMRLDVSDGGQSFLLPQYGGVAFHNLPREAPIEAHYLSLAALSPSFHLFVQHLYSLLAIPPLPQNAFGTEHSFAGLSPFQLETLMRIRLIENVEEAQKTLAGITRLVDKIKEMKVGEGVRGKVLGAVQRLEEILLAEQGVNARQAFELSRDAVTLANEAFFDPSMMGLLYFPTEHKASVYSPLFAPVAVPIVLFLLKEAVAYRRSQSGARKPLSFTKS